MSREGASAGPTAADPSASVKAAMDPTRRPACTTPRARAAALSGLVVVLMTLGTGCNRRPAPPPQPPVAVAVAPAEPRPTGPARRVDPDPPDPEEPASDPRIPDRPREPIPELIPPVAVAAHGSPCADTPWLLACAAARGGGGVTPHRLAMASGGGAIAIAWVEAGNAWLSTSPGRPSARVHLALYDDKLERRAHAELPTRGPATDARIVATDDGWIVAAQTTAGVELHWRRADLGPRPTHALLAGASSPGLVATAAGGALLVAQLRATSGVAPIVATLFDPQGAARWSAEAFAGAVEPHFGGQVAADRGAYLIARRSDGGVSIRRIEADGRPAELHAVHTSTEYPALAWCGDSGRFVWTDFGGHGHVRVARVDRSGAITGPQHPLGGTPDYFNHSQPLCDRDGALVLLAGYTGSTGVSNRLDLVRVDRSGRLPGAIPVVAADGRTTYDPQIARLDRRRVVVAWIAMSPAHAAASIAIAVLHAPEGDTAAPAQIAE
jgi:hypothetical protein